MAGGARVGQVDMWCQVDGADDEAELAGLVRLWCGDVLEEFAREWNAPGLARAGAQVLVAWEAVDGDGAGNAATLAGALAELQRVASRREPVGDPALRGDVEWAAWLAQVGCVSAVRAVEVLAAGPGAAGVGDSVWACRCMLVNLAAVLGPSPARLVCDLVGDSVPVSRARAAVAAAVGGP